MKLQTSALLVVIAIVAFAGCSSQSSKKPEAGKGAATFTEFPLEQGQSAQAVAVRPGEPGALAVQTYELTATVSRIDKATRKVTLVAADGSETVIKAGPEVANFDQLQVGDQVKATLTEQLAVFVRKSGEAAPSPQITTVALAPLGAKPGMVMADTVELTGKVTAIDPEKHQATVQFADGQSKTFKVRADVDLTRHSVGDEVVIRSTESMAIRVEKP